MSEAFWHNFATGEYEFRTPPTTDEEAIEYLPQDPAVHNLYSLYRLHGDLSIGQAMVNVLSSAVGEDAPFPPSFAPEGGNDDSNG